MAVAYASSSTKDDGQTSSTTHTITKPTGTVDGDVLVCIISYANNGFITLTPPTGWTQIGSEAGSGDTTVSLDAYYKVASGEPASYTFTLSSSSDAQIEMARYTGAASGSEINASAMSALSAASTSATAPSITTTVNNCMLVHMCGERDGSTAPTWTPPSSPGSFTERLDFGTTFYGGMELSDFTQATAGSTGTVTATCTQTAKNAAAIVAIAPSGGGGGPAPTPGVLLLPGNLRGELSGLSGYMQ